MEKIWEVEATIIKSMFRRAAYRAYPNGTKYKKEVEEFDSTLDQCLKGIASRAMLEVNNVVFELADEIKKM